jgi:hypothetical protein
MYKHRAQEFMSLAREDKNLGMSAYLCCCQTEMTAKVLEDLLADPDRLEALYDRDRTEHMTSYWKQCEEFAAKFLELPYILNFIKSSGNLLARKYTPKQVKTLKAWVSELERDLERQGSQP